MLIYIHTLPSLCPRNRMAKWRTKKTAAAGAPMAPPEKGGGGGHAPAEELLISVPLHCDGCARKVRRSVQRLNGVDEVMVDCSTNTVVVRGPKVREDPAMVVEIVERRTGKTAVLLRQSPAKLPPSPAKDVEQTKKDASEEDMKKERKEDDMEMSVVLRIDLHCDACSEEIKRRILKIKGVEEAVPHMKSSQLMVKGMVEPAILVSFIHKCTGRKAAILRAEPVDLDKAQADATGKQQHTYGNQEQKMEDEKDDEMEGSAQEEDGAGEEEGNVEKPNEGNGTDDAAAQADEKPHNATSGVVKENNAMDHLFKLPVPDAVVAVAPAESDKMMATNCQHYYLPAYPYAFPYQYPQLGSYTGYPAIYGYPQYPPQAFSDENPNVCTVM